MPDTMTRDEMILAWNTSVAALAAAKDHEMAMRKMVCAELFGLSEDELRKGTETIDLGNGYKLKMVAKINVSFVSDDAVRNALEAIEVTGPVGAHVADRLVKWKPTLSETEYKQLDPMFAVIIDQVIVKRPASPALEFIEPKSAK